MQKSTRERVQCKTIHATFFPLGKTCFAYENVFKHIHILRYAQCLEYSSVLGVELGVITAEPLSRSPLREVLKTLVDRKEITSG